MTQEYNLVKSLNNNTLWLKIQDPWCNAVSNENSITTLAQSIVKKISDITQLQIIENLSLLGNQLPQLPSNFTESIANLVYLDLSDNRLSNLPDSVNMLKMLTYLNLDNNQFFCLPNVVCELSSLKTLKTRKNHIRYVPNNLENLSNLQDLDLSYNELEYLPDSCTNLHQLKNLSLAGNCFKVIPECVAKGMENLQIFDFSYNYNSKLNVSPKSSNLNTFYAESNYTCPLFPNWILSSKYNNLETISFNKTRFKKFCLPKNPTRSYIKKLSMVQCKLDDPTVDKIIKDMTNLEELIIGNIKFSSNNYFWDIPIEKVKEPSSLKKLDVHNTGIPMVSNIIRKFVNLSVIDISSNNIFWLPEEICSLKKLSSLNIQKNKLTALPKSIGELISLKELKVCCNQLSELPESIGGLSNLQYLDLYDNEFEMLPETIKNLPSLLGVDLEQNYFSTDCLSLNRDTPYESMRDDLREHWREEAREINGFKLKLSDSSESSSDDERKLSLSSNSREDSPNVAVCALPEGTFNQLENECWDSSEDSADEFDPHECKEPRKRVYSPFTFYKPLQQVYCPAESHQPRIITRVTRMLQEGTLVWSSSYEEGQFEDC
ncbi:leucine-rich repeat protein SHOC-2-like [Osmia bicornis bicornis]|uniref:leucine-rich repeat protein SHOC-2-like n=1 Tax=Osmia bicornis bicornis TaxID=1437191 RepID=UPI0010FA0886|nr:leucine-rich repeat protein SHOC-2-like [Osmia bicornis bicornis]